MSATKSTIARIWSIVSLIAILFGPGAGAIAAPLGQRVGDSLGEIDGFPVTTPDSASTSPLSFAATYDGESNERAYGIQPTADGGYIVAGETHSFGTNGDAWVLKLNADGSIAWQKAYGGVDNDAVRAIQLTADGGYIVAGDTFSFGVGTRNLWVLKLNGDGSVAWQKTYGGAGNELATAIQPTADSGYIVTGCAHSFGIGDSDVWVLKLNGDGSVAWQKTYGSGYYDCASAIQPTSDGGYAVAGETFSFGAGGADVWVLKLNGDGSVAWQKTYGGADGEVANAIQPTVDGGYVVAGRTDSFGANSEAWILKLNGDGSVAWQKTYGGTDDEEAFDVQPTADGGYVVAGRTDSFGVNAGDGWLLKLNGDGSVAWQKTYGGSSVDHVNAIQLTGDGGYAVAGETFSFGASGVDVWVLKLNGDGTLGAGCTLGVDSAATPADTGATVADSSATVADTSATPADSNAAVVDTTASPDYACADWCDLRIVKTVAPAVAAPGDAVTYTLDFSNLGLADAAGIVISDTVPASVTGVSVSYSGAGITPRAGTRYVWDVSDLAPGEGGVIVITGVLSPALAAGVLLNTAVITTTEVDIDLGNNRATAPLTVMGLSFAAAYGGGNNDRAYAVQPTVDGGYIVAGETHSFGTNGDAWVLKLNDDGSVAWQKAYGGADDDAVRAIQPTADGGYIVAGDTFSFGVGTRNLWVLKLNGDGSVAWEKTYGGADNEFATAIQPTADGGYIVAGDTHSFGTGGSDVWVLKLNGDGSVAWQKVYGGGDGADTAAGIQPTSDGGYVVAGNTFSFGVSYRDGWVLKLNGDGSVAWQKTYGGTDDDVVIAIQPTADGGYVAAGRTTSFGTSADAWVLKLNGDGSAAWQKTYGGTGGDIVYGIQPTLDGGYVASGYTDSFGTNGDGWAFKLNGDGSVAWQKTYGVGSADHANAIQLTADGGYVVAGDTGSAAGDDDVWVLKLNDDGTLGAGCGLGVDSAATPADTGATVADSSATIADTSATPADSNAAVVDTTASPDYACADWCDLRIAKTVAPAVAASGDAVAYTLDFSNAGPADAAGVVISDTVPAGVTGVSVSYSGASVTPRAGTRYVWDVSDLAPGEGGVIVITGVLSPSLAAGTLANATTISAAVVDVNPGDNTDSADLTVSPVQFVTQWGSQGSGDGQFRAPQGIAVNGAGQVYVSDLGNNRVQKFDGDGNFLLKWGSYGTGNRQFKRPMGIAVDGADDVYVAVSREHGIKKYTQNSLFITRWGSWGDANGEFKSPSDVAVDDIGNVYVSDTYNYRIQRFDSAGNFVAKGGSPGIRTGNFDRPCSVAVDGVGDVYVADCGNHRIQKFDSQGRFLAQWGGFGSGDDQFRIPGGIAVDGAGNVYVADVGNHCVKKFDGQGNLLFKWGGQGDGTYQFYRPRDVAVTDDGYIYVLDMGNRRVCKFFDPTAVAFPTQDYASSDTPLSDPHTIVSTINVPDSGVVYDIDVTLNISHAYVSDMVIDLVSPSGTAIRLFGERGGDGDHLAGTTFDDQAIDSIASGAAPFSTTFRPEFPLRVLSGESIQGDWQLRVADAFTRADDPTLQGWTIALTYEPAPVVQSTGAIARSVAVKMAFAPGKCLGGDISLIDNIVSYGYSGVEMSDYYAKIEQVRTSHVGDWGCVVKGNLRLELPGNDVQSTAIIGRVDHAGHFGSWGIIGRVDHAGHFGSWGIIGRVDHAGPIPPHGIMDFDLEVAGFALQMQNAQFRDGQLQSTATYLKAPSKWGGLGNAQTFRATISDQGLQVVEDMMIAGFSLARDSQHVTIPGSGLRPDSGDDEFSLPDLQAGDFGLYRLHGELSPVAAGYEITATGRLGAPNLDSSNDCYVKVETVISTDGDLGELTPSVVCDGAGVPIGQTGFVLSDVTGTFTLQPDSQALVLDSVEIQSTEELTAGVPLIRGVGPATLTADGLTLNGPLDVLGLTAAATDVHLGETSGLTATVSISSTDLYATLPIQAWQDGDTFNLTGSGAGAIRHPSLGWLRNTETHLGHFPYGYGFRYGFAGYNASTGFFADDQGALTLIPTGTITLASLTVDATDLAATEIAWDLDSVNTPVRLTFYAHPGPVSQMLNFTDPLGSGSGSFDRYQGVQVGQTTAGAGAGLHTVDLSGLESGDVYLWAQVGDGLTTPLYRYAAPISLRSNAPALADGIPIDHSGTFTESWTTAITISTALDWGITQMDGLIIQWDPHTHPDVDGYAVFVNTKPGMPLAATDVITTGDTSGVAIWGSVEPGSTYYVSVGAYDEQSGQLVRSNEVSKTMTSGDFDLILPGNSFRLDAGEAVTVTLVVSKTSDLFYDLDLHAYTPSGISDTLKIVDVRVIGEVTLAKVEAYLTTDASLDDGEYVVPFWLYSGELFRSQDVHLLVGRQPYDPYYVVVPPEGVSGAPFGNGVTLTVASGTFGEVVTFTLTPQPPTDTGALWDVDRFFTLDVTNASGSAVLPGGAYTITAAYDASSVPNVLSEHTLGFYYYQEGDPGGWQREPTSQVDVAADTVTAHPDHLSLWALLYEHVSMDEVYLPVILR